MQALVDASLRTSASPVERPAARPSRQPELAVHALSARYGETPVFEGVSFTIESGEIVALLGANGAGKSTLLRCCLGLVRPWTGTARLFGEDVAAVKRSTLSRLQGQCGFVAQKHNLVPRMSVLTNVVHGLLGRRPGPRHWSHVTAPRHAREQALAALDQVGLAHLAGRRADKLSGGQSQRVAIARALVSAPQIVFADEPAASLDPAAGEEVMALLLDLARQTGTTVVFTSHHIEHALRYSDRLIALKDGRLSLDLRSGEIGRERLLQIYG